MTITVYTKPGCPQCRATTRHLDRNGLEHTVIDLTRDSDAYAHVTSLGYASAPVVEVGDRHWSGFRPDRIDELA